MDDIVKTSWISISKSQRGACGVIHRVPDM